MIALLITFFVAMSLTVIGAFLGASWSAIVGMWFGCAIGSVVATFIDSRVHIHRYHCVKTGVDFTYSDEALAAMPDGQRAVNAFAGPIVDVYECRCGARKCQCGAP